MGGTITKEVIFMKIMEFDDWTSSIKSEFSAENFFGYMALVYNGVEEVAFRICEETVGEVKNFVDGKDYKTFMPANKNVSMDLNTEYVHSSLCFDDVDVSHLSIRTDDPKSKFHGYSDYYGPLDLYHIMNNLEMGPDDVVRFTKFMEEERMVDVYKL